MEQVNNNPTHQIFTSLIQFTVFNWQQMICMSHSLEQYININNLYLKILEIQIVVYKAICKMFNIAEQDNFIFNSNEGMH